VANELGQVKVPDVGRLTEAPSLEQVTAVEPTVIST